jgi:hypothetical protein
MSGGGLLVASYARWLQQHSCAAQPISSATHTHACKHTHAHLAVLVRYRGVWRHLDVAVKVLQHDASTALAISNEVDLVMSFRCVCARLGTIRAGLLEQRAVERVPRCACRGCKTLA